MTISLYNSPSHATQEHVELIKEYCASSIPEPVLGLAQYWESALSAWIVNGLPDDYMLSVARVTSTEALEYVVCVINQIAIVASY